MLIQCQAVNVACSGVVFTRDIQNNKPYYLINYDETGSTDSVTSGSAGRMMKVVRNVDENTLDTPWKELLKAVRELEHIMEGLALDIEFAIDKENRIILFQMRPLVASYKQGSNYDDPAFFYLLENAANMYLQHKNVITGEPMMMSDMAFWNPSEIIGTNPRPLDYSLYRAIITHQAWNQGIVKLGFRKLSEDLMHRIGNKPYICLEYAFYSLIPQRVPEELAKRLVHYYQNALRHNLTAHDKIEFEIVFSSYDFGTEQRTRKLLDFGFSEQDRTELLESLKAVTEHAITEFDRILEEDLNSLKKLEEIRKRRKASSCRIGNHPSDHAGGAESSCRFAALWNPSVCAPSPDGIYGKSFSAESDGKWTQRAGEKRRKDLVYAGRCRRFHAVHFHGLYKV